MIGHINIDHKKANDIAYNHLKKTYDTNALFKSMRLNIKPRTEDLLAWQFSMNSIKIKEDWKVKNGLYKCPFCDEVKSKMGIGSHIWRKHENGINHKTNNNI